MSDRYFVRLSPDKRLIVDEVANRQGFCIQMTHLARVLLYADVDGPGLAGCDFAEAAHTLTARVEKVCGRCEREDLEWSLRGRQCKFGRSVEATGDHVQWRHGLLCGCQHVDRRF